VCWGVRDVDKVPSVLLYQHDEFIGPCGVPHSGIPEGVVGVEVTRDDAALRSNQLHQGSRDSVELGGRFFFVVHVEDVQWGDEGSNYFKDLDIGVLTHIRSGSDLEVGVVTGDVGGHTVGTASNMGWKEEENVGVGGSIPGVLDICFLDQDDV
jgi:hypothetical protein